MRNLLIRLALTAVTAVAFVGAVSADYNPGWP